MKKIPFYFLSVSLKFILVLTIYSCNTFGDIIATSAGAIALFIIIQTIVFSIAAPLFIYWDKIATWKKAVGVIGIIFIGRMVFMHFTKEARRNM